MKRILLVGGGSGGHVYPLVAVANALRKQAEKNGKKIKLMMMGNGRFAREAARESEIEFRQILSWKLRRYTSSKTILELINIPFGIIQALWHVFWFMPNVIFTKGGHASVLPAIVGKLYFIPIYTHETDSVPGLANRLLAKLSKKVLVSFKNTESRFKHGKALFVGNPIRRELLGGNRNEALKYFNFDPVKKTILITGGSQGAQAINNVILNSLVRLVEKYHIIHQVGEGNMASIKTEIGKLIKEGEGSYGDNIQKNYRLFPFLNMSEMRLAYASADIVISRAGGAMFEISALGKPVIIIPIANTRGDHQIKNAFEISEYGAIVIEEENLTPNILISQIEHILDPNNYLAISERIKGFAKLDSADKIAEILL